MSYLAYLLYMFQSYLTIDQIKQSGLAHCRHVAKSLVHYTKSIVVRVSESYVLVKYCLHIRCLSGEHR